METDLYTKALFGCHAVRVPLHMKVQEAGNGIVLVVATSTDELRFGSQTTHQLVLCDAVIRPVLVLETERFQGHGASGLATQHPIEWRGARIVLNPLGLDEKDPISAYEKLKL